MSSKNKKVLPKTKKTVDKMSMSVNQINERLKSLDLKLKEKRALGKESHKKMLTNMRDNPHYKALTQEYQHAGGIGARHSGSDDPIHDKEYISDVVRAHVMNGTPMDTLRTTAYVKALVDPEGSGENAGVPDCLPLDTYRYQSIVELNIGPSYFDRLGRTVVVSTPDIVDHVMLPAPTAIDEIYSFICASRAPFARTGDLFDTNLMDPAFSRIVDTPDFRLHFASSVNDSAETIGTQVQTSNMGSGSFGAGQELWMLGGTGFSDTFSIADVPVVKRSLNPGRLRDYPFATAADDISRESMWSIDSAASTVDKIMLPSQVSFGADNTPHVVYPFYCDVSSGRPVRSGAHWIGDIPIGTITGSMMPTTSSVWINGATANSSCIPFVIVSVYGFQLGDGTGANADGAPVRIDYIFQVGPARICQVPLAGLDGPPSSFHLNIDEAMMLEGPSFAQVWVEDASPVTNYNSAVAIDSVSFGGFFLQSTPAFTGAGLTIANLVGHPASVDFDHIDFAYKVGVSAVNLVTTRGEVGYIGPNAWNPFQVGCVLGAYSVDQLAAFSSGLWTQYRPVSMSAWMTYIGGTLNDIGEIYGAFIPDHRYVADRDHNYLSPSGLSSIANCYRGKAPLGAYGIWKPTSEDDLKLRPLSSKWNFDRGFTVFSVVSGTDPLAQNFVLRVVANFEVITLAAVYRESLRQSQIDHAQLWGAFQLLEHFPMVMANDEHESAISSFFSGLWNGVKKAAGFVSKNIGPIANIAKGIGSIV